MNLKFDMDNPADREKLRRAILDLVAGEKNAESKNGIVEILSFCFWQALCSAILGPRNFAPSALTEENSAPMETTTRLRFTSLGNLSAKSMRNVFIAIGRGEFDFVLRDSTGQSYS